MFRLQSHDEPLKWPVKVNVPQSGGVVRKHTFNAEFLFLEQEEAEAAVESGDEEFLLKVVQGWEHVQDEAGEELPFNRDNLVRLIKVGYIKAALISAYFEMLAGIKRKN